MVMVPGTPWWLWLWLSLSFHFLCPFLHLAWSMNLVRNFSTTHEKSRATLRHLESAVTVSRPQKGWPIRHWDTRLGTASCTENSDDVTFFDLKNLQLVEGAEVAWWSWRTFVFWIQCTQHEGSDPSPIRVPSEGRNSKRIHRFGRLQWLHPTLGAQPWDDNIHQKTDASWGQLSPKDAGGWFSTGAPSGWFCRSGMPCVSPVIRLMSFGLMSWWWLLATKKKHLQLISKLLISVYPSFITLSAFIKISSPAFFQIYFQERIPFRGTNVGWGDGSLFGRFRRQSRAKALDGWDHHHCHSTLAIGCLLFPFCEDQQGGSRTQFGCKWMLFR